MSPHPQPRFFLVLWRARWFYVWYLSGTQLRSSIQTFAVTHHHARLPYRTLQPQRTLGYSNPATLQNRLNPIQTP
jgi:hypothetical protein